MKYTLRAVLLRSTLYLGGVLCGAVVSLIAADEISTRYELASTGSTSIAELKDDYGWPITAVLVGIPALVLGVGLGVLAVWVALHFWDKRRAATVDEAAPEAVPGA